jgi:hypothetical protein
MKVIIRELGLIGTVLFTIAPLLAASLALGLLVT